MSSASRGLAPREGLDCLLVKMGCTRPLVEPRRGPQAGKSGDPRSQNADRKQSRTRPGQSSPLDPDHPQTSTKHHRFLFWTT